jgi:hypothetical protein
MKTIIAGSRNIIDYSLVLDAYNKAPFAITEIVSGGARGVDKLGEEVARNKGLPIKIFPADWTKYGNRAGPIRNAEMAKYADALIAVWDGQSKGTFNMIQQATNKGLEIFIYRLDTNE